MKILITGALGQLGQAVVHELSGRHEVIAFSRSELDISNARAVSEAVARARPDAIVNCAAFTDVDGAESDPVAALEANAFAVRSLARAADDVGASLFHFSTDFVFDGEIDRPYVEEDPANPTSTYGSSKLLGEWFALHMNGGGSRKSTGPSQSYVLRVESLFGGPQARSSIDRIIAAIERRDEARVFVDRTVSPSYVIDVAAVVMKLLESPAPPGLYHCVNTGYCTWYELGVETARLLGIEPRLTGIRLDELQLRARRPRFCALANDKLRRVGVSMPSWQEALARYLRTRRPATRSAGL